MHPFRRTAPCCRPGGAAWLWSPEAEPPATITLSVLLAMSVSATLGILLPAVLHAPRLDPKKVAAGPLVLRVGDLATMSIYLGLATWWLL